MKLRLSGVLVRIENVGYVFCRGVKLREMRENSLRFSKISTSLQFTPVAQVLNKPASHLMRAIHNLNEVENLPGIVKFIDSQKNAA